MRKMGSVPILVLALLAPGLCAAQTEAPGEPVTLPGAEFSSWQVKEDSGRFGRPGSNATVPALLILPGSAWVDGRGAFYPSALQEAGVATLEIVMFQSPGRPRAGNGATM